MHAQLEAETGSTGTDAQQDWPDSLLTPAQAAIILGLSEYSLRQYRYEGRGPDYLKKRGRIIYRRADLIAYLEKQGREAQERAAARRARARVNEARRALAMAEMKAKRLGAIDEAAHQPASPA